MIKIQEIKGLGIEGLSKALDEEIISAEKINKNIRSAKRLNLEEETKLDISYEVSQQILLRLQQLADDADSQGLKKQAEELRKQAEDYDSKINNVYRRENKIFLHPRQLRE